MLPLSKNPPSRYPEGPLLKGGKPWWVAKVKSRQEKAFAFDLLKREIEYYLPMIMKITRRKDNNKPRKSILPLFSGYVSFCAEQHDARNLFTTNRVSSIIEVRGQNEFIRQLNKIYHTIDLKIPIEPVSLAKLELGLEVEVDAGPMRGTRGKVVKNLSGNKIAIFVEGLGVAVITVDAAMVSSVE